jgi:hypothetical protein
MAEHILSIHPILPEIPVKPTLLTGLSIVHSYVATSPMLNVHALLLFSCEDAVQG